MASGEEEEEGAMASEEEEEEEDEDEEKMWKKYTTAIRTQPYVEKAPSTTKVSGKTSARSMSTL